MNPSESSGTDKRTVNLLGIDYTTENYFSVVDQVADWIGCEQWQYIVLAPVSNIIEARWNQEHFSALENAGLVTPDGMPIVWLQKALGHPEASRVYGPTLMLHLLERAEREGWRVGLYGGHEDRLHQLVEELGARYPKLKLPYYFSPPFRPLEADEEEAVRGKINDARVDLLFVGLGCPKQEKWMQKHQSHLSAVMVGVGAAFDFHAGAVKQAPSFLQKIGMEWFFRLCCEPRRLWKRYVTTIPPFLVLAMWQVMRYHARRLTGVESPTTAETVQT